MNNIGGEAWFPVTGNIILREGIPICSVPNNEQVYNVMDALTIHNKGVKFTCISANGWYIQQVDKEEGGDNAG